MVVLFAGWEVYRESKGCAVPCLYGYGDKGGLSGRGAGGAVLQAGRGDERVERGEIEEIVCYRLKYTTL